MVGTKKHSAGSMYSLSKWTIAAGIFCLAVVGRTGYWFVEGTVPTPSSGLFLGFCGLNGTQYLTELVAQDGAELVLYAGYWIPLCIVQRVTGGSLDAMVGFQIVLSSLACVFVFDIGRRHVSLGAGAIAGIGQAVLFDGFAWTTRILGDSMLVFVLVVCLWRLGIYIESPTSLNRYSVWICFGYLSVTRPYGFPIVAGWIAYDLLPRDSDLRLSLFPYRRAALVLLTVTVPVAIVILLRWGQEFMPGFWIRGALVADDPTFPRYPFELARTGNFITFIGRNIHHIVAMGVLKVGVFFLPFVPRFSLAHILLNIVTYVPIYALGFVGAGHLYRHDRQLFTLWVTPVVVVIGIISVTFVDYSWGYRAPTGPVFALLAGYALSVHPHFESLRTIGGRIGQQLRFGQ